MTDNQGAAAGPPVSGTGRTFSRERRIQLLSRPTVHETSRVGDAPRNQRMTSLYDVPGKWNVRRME